MLPYSLAASIFEASRCTGPLELRHTCLGRQRPLDHDGGDSHLGQATISQDMLQHQPFSASSHCFRQTRRHDYRNV